MSGTGTAGGQAQATAGPLKGADMAQQDPMQMQGIGADGSKMQGLSSPFFQPMFNPQMGKK